MILDLAIAERRKRLARARRKRFDALDADHVAGEDAEDCRVVTRACADVKHALGSRSCHASVIAATMDGCEIVCPSPMASARSSYAKRTRSRRAKASRGTRPIASENVRLANAARDEMLVKSMT